MIKNCTLIVTVALVLCASPPSYADSTRNLSAESKNTVSRLLAKCAPANVCAVRTTAYTHTEDDHIEFSNKTAIGTTLKFGEKFRSAASDWSIYPLGTKFQIIGLPYVYVIDDYGIALTGKNTIDLYKPSKQAMNAWGARNVKIKVLEWGSFSKSKKMMTSASKKYAFIKKMYDSIDQRFYGLKRTAPKEDPVNKALNKDHSDFFVVAKARAASRFGIALNDEDKAKLAKVDPKVAMAN